jgi:hypothetical protein
MSRTLKVVQNDTELIPPPTLLDFTPVPTRKRHAISTSASARSLRRRG